MGQGQNGSRAIICIDIYYDIILSSLPPRHIKPLLQDDSLFYMNIFTYALLFLCFYLLAFELLITLFTFHAIRLLTSHYATLTPCVTPSSTLRRYAFLLSYATPYAIDTLIR